MYVSSRREVCLVPRPFGTSVPGPWSGAPRVSGSESTVRLRKPGFPSPAASGGGSVLARRWFAHPFSLQARVVATVDQDRAGGDLSGMFAGVGVSSGEGRPTGREPLALVDEWPMAIVLSSGMGSLVARGRSALGIEGSPDSRVPSVSSMILMGPSRWGALRVDRVGYGEHLGRSPGVPPSRWRAAPGVLSGCVLGRGFDPSRARLVIPPGVRRARRAWWARGEQPPACRALDKGVTWLILPVVICLSQRLSHACLSISNLYSETANGSLNQL
jgi:hypothetical protein